jgi:hypothetical protein
VQAAAKRFDALPVALERRLIAGDAQAWSAFRASLALDVARYLAALDPLIEEVYLCMSPEPADTHVVLAVRVERETPALAIVAEALDRELCAHMRARGLGRVERMMEVHIAGRLGPEASGGIMVVNNHRAVPVRIWKR